MTSPGSIPPDAAGAQAEAGMRYWNAGRPSHSAGVQAEAGALRGTPGRARCTLPEYRHTLLECRQRLAHPCRTLPVRLQSLA